METEMTYDLPFAPADFRRILDYVAEQVKSPAPKIDPSNRGLLLVGDDGQVSELTFTDCPENRFGFAVVGLFPDDPSRAYSFISRWKGVQELISNGALDERWYRRATEKGEGWLDDRVVELAATFPQEQPTLFDQKSFLEALEKPV